MERTRIIRRLTEAGLAVALGLLAGPWAASTVAAEPVEGRQSYILVNLRHNEITSENFEKIKRLEAGRQDRGPRIGAGTIFSYLRRPREQNINVLQRFLALAESYDLPVIVQLDGEQWWQNRPDLWNWWDPDTRGYNPANAANVEWSGWGPQHALKIAWRNWGRQVRTLPPPNLMSPRYRAACHEEMQPYLTEVVRWWTSLPADKRWLLVGVKVGWESAIGVSNYYYPDGNRLVDADPASDPRTPIRGRELPGRGFQPIGYAAVATLGLADRGELREEHLTEVVRRHLADLAAAVRAAGLPRDHIFVHGGGWAEGERLYGAALNEDSCPGWSFYRHAVNPRNDKTAMEAVAASDAPYWAAAEWWAQGAHTADQWQAAIGRTLSIDGCRYVCIFSWRQLADNPAALEGIRRSLAAAVYRH